jgi:hypothetical protein
MRDDSYTISESPVIKTYEVVALMAYARFMHGAPGTSNFDVYAGGRRLYSNLNYGMYSDYLYIPDGLNQLALYPAGSLVNPLVNSSIALTPGGYYTFALSGFPGGVTMLPLPEQLPAISPGQSYIRVVHLSPNAPNMDISLPDGTVLFGNVGYNARTGYVALSPGAYSLLVSPTGTNQVIMTIPSLSLAPGATYTVALLGLMGSSSNPLRALIAQDGTGIPMG